MHTKGGGGVIGKGGYATGPPRGTFVKHVDKNAIKPKMVDPPGNFVQKVLTPTRNFGKKIQLFYPL